ncbi:hypothetical protein [Paenibacillus sp. 1P07SE]|uniref:hypothetical protein n=1 Tax=Paenibacillus sp. 1P07SE TaxID=3132209 RepID=UPI0039A76ACC
MGDIKVLFWFDVEDFINPQSEEALVGILDLLDSRGIAGIFKFVGEKIRQLEAHGRTDIIERLSRHEVGYHTNWHSVPPVVTEYLEPLGFREGTDEFERREEEGQRDLERISGQPVICYGQPGQAWAPQVFPVLAKWGIRTYIDGHDQISLNQRPFWYGGLLNLTSLVGLMGMPLEEGALEPAKRRFDELCEMQKDEDIGLISIVYHPTEFVFAEFWDAVNFSGGKHPPPSAWVKPAARPAGDMQRYLDMLGEFVDYTLSREGVSYVMTGQLLAVERTDNRALSDEEVRRFAGLIGDQLNFVVDGTRNLSASELFWVFRQHLLGEESIPQLVYGPEREIGDELPGTVPGETVEASQESQEVQRVTAQDGGAARVQLPGLYVQDLLNALKDELPTVCGFRQLPDFFVVGGHKVSPATMTCTMAAVIREGRQAEAPLQWISGQLAAGRYSSTSGEWTKWWPIFTPDLKVPGILELARLQTWTLKPALL